MDNNITIKKTILWDITRRCNLNCIHCYNFGSIASSLELDIEKDHKSIIDRFVKAGINHIHLLGGEPLLTNGLFEMINYANKCGVLVSINTNGTLLNKEMINRLIELQLFQLTISLDGATQLTNDEIRGSGSFERVVENVKRTVACIHNNNSPMIVQIATVITRKNLSTIHKLPRLLKEIGVQYLDILKLYECGNASKNALSLSITSKEYLDAICKLIFESYRNQIFTQIDCKPKVLNIINKRFGFQIEKFNISFAKCCAGKQIIFMDHKGNIFPCGPYSHTLSDPELQTNIFAENYIESLKIIENSISDKIRINTNELKPICKNCQFKSVCGGCAICFNNYEELCEEADKLYR